jgi:hypothetical protein
MTGSPTPAVGQIWQHNDERSYGRRIRIAEIDGTHALVEPVIGRDHALLQSGRRTRIRLDRFRPTRNGYQYVAEADR